jgi:beta-lysine 5,6-aminomutase alpha subunit
MQTKLGLDFRKVEQARLAAQSIAEDVQMFVNQYTTVAVERTVCRLLGIDGVDEYEVPLPNIVVEAMKENNCLHDGAVHLIGRAILDGKGTPQEIAKKISTDQLDIHSLQQHSTDAVLNAVHLYIQKAIERISENRKRRESILSVKGDSPRPYLYAIVATGNIYEDIVQAQAAVRQGADVIAVIRTTGQSLLDYVPYGATTEGFGGTYATQENFRIMRKALDEVGDEVGRYVRLCNYCSGLCMQIGRAHV